MTSTPSEQMRIVEGVVESLASANTQEAKRLSYWRSTILDGVSQDYVSWAAQGESGVEALRNEIERRKDEIGGPQLSQDALIGLGLVTGQQEGADAGKGEPVAGTTATVSQLMGHQVDRWTSGQTFDHVIKVAADSVQRADNDLIEETLRMMQADPETKNLTEDQFNDKMRFELRDKMNEVNSIQFLKNMAHEANRYAASERARRVAKLGEQHAAAIMAQGAFEDDDAAIGAGEITRGYRAADKADTAARRELGKRSGATRKEETAKRSAAAVKRDAIFNKAWEKGLNSASFVHERKEKIMVNALRDAIEQGKRIKDRDMTAHVGSVSEAYRIKLSYGEKGAKVLDLVESSILNHKPTGHVILNTSEHYTEEARKAAKQIKKAPKPYEPSLLHPDNYMPTPALDPLDSNWADPSLPVETLENIKPVWHDLPLEGDQRKKRKGKGTPFNLNAIESATGLNSRQLWKIGKAYGFTGTDEEIRNALLKFQYDHPYTRTRTK